MLSLCVCVKALLPKIFPVQALPLFFCRGRQGIDIYQNSITLIKFKNLEFSFFILSVRRAKAHDVKYKVHENEPFELNVQFAVATNLPSSSTFFSSFS